MIAKPPASLVGVGAEEWTRVVTLLVDRGQWDPLRSTVLLAYCEAYTDWHRLSTAARGKELNQTGREARPESAPPGHRARPSVAPARTRGAAQAGAVGVGPSPELVAGRGGGDLVPAAGRDGPGLCGVLLLS